MTYEIHYLQHIDMYPLTVDVYTLQHQSIVASSVSLLTDARCNRCAVAHFTESKINSRFFNFPFTNARC